MTTEISVAVDRREDVRTPVIAAAQGAFADIAGLENEFAGRAVIRQGPVDSPAEVAALTEGASALAVTLHRMSAEHIAALAPSVKVLARAGVGLDTIDLEAAAAAGVNVVYQPNYATSEVADQAAALALSAWRRTAAADSLMRTKGWASAQEVGTIDALQEATVGVLGVGRIGRAFVDRIRPFVHRVVVHDVRKPEEDLAGVEWCDTLADLLSVSNLLSLHLPLNAQTRGILDAAALAQLPRGAVVINVSRGGLVDEAALTDALISGHLGGAGLDVFEQEPLPAESSLRAAPNLVMSPHLAWYSVSAGKRLASWTFEDAVALSNGEPVVRGTIV